MEEIKYVNRASGKIEKEHVYGEGWLKFTYTSCIGRIFLWTVVKRKLFSMLYGFFANGIKSKSRISPFIEKYKVDVNEFEQDVESFTSFNDFFSRKLKASARPIDPNNSGVIFPADGRHMGFQDIDQAESIYVKGQKFKLSELFGSDEMAKPYMKGSLVISRLCPVDYHRFHFPCEGIIEKVDLINGVLLSVNPISLRQNLSVFWENKRYLSFLNSKNFGRIAQFAVGATCVGSVTFTTEANSHVYKGDESGYFSFGGSSILTFFEKDRIVLAKDLTDASQKGMELYAKMGEVMGARP